jgi:hypothetical protein
MPSTDCGNSQTRALWFFDELARLLLADPKANPARHSPADESHIRKLVTPFIKISRGPGCGNPHRSSHGARKIR